VSYKKVLVNHVTFMQLIGVTMMIVVRHLWVAVIIVMPS